MRSDRVLYFPLCRSREAMVGRKPKRGAEFKFEDAARWPAPVVTTTSATSGYGEAVVRSWDRLHPVLVRRSAWADYPEGELPVIEWTVIRLEVDHLPGDRDPKPGWLRWSRTGATAADVDRLWHAFLRRFDLERTFRMMKQSLGWTTPKLREPAAADAGPGWSSPPTHPTPPRPPSCRRPPNALGRTRTARTPHACSSPQGTPPPPREDTSARRGTKTPRPGQPAGSKNKHPAREDPVGKQSKTETGEATRNRQAA